MKKLSLFAVILAASFALPATDASAVVCAKGVYRAGCVGPRGAVVGQRAYRGAYVHGYRRYGYSGTTIRHRHGPYGSRTVIRRH